MEKKIFDWFSVDNIVIQVFDKEKYRTLVCDEENYLQSNLVGFNITRFQLMDYSEIKQFVSSVQFWLW